MPGASREARGQGVSEGRKIELVDSRWKHSQNYNQAYLGKLQRWYDAYRGVWQGRLAAFRNNVNIPFTFAMIQSDVARKVQTSFGAWPIVSFEGYAPEDVARAKKNEVLISAQMKDASSVLKAVDFFLQADICGTGIARIGWKTLRRMTRTRRMEQVAPGFSVPVVREQETTLFDGPIWETVDRLDFGQQPGRSRIDDMGWVCHRYYVDWDDLWDDVNSETPYFDREAVMRLKAFPMGSSSQESFARRRVVFRSEYDYQARQQERFGKPVEIIEMHGLVPREFVTDNIRHRCIAVANGRVVLKDREGPLGYQKPFFAYCPMPDPYSFDGVAKTEVAFGPQQTANRLANQKLDAIDHLIDPMYVASSQANINTQHLFTRAGRIILVDGAADESVIRPLTPDMRGLQAAYAEISQLFQFMQLGTGETETLLGGITGNTRETARGVLARQENALTRLTMESRIAEEGFIEPLANSFRDMDRKWLSMPHEVRILGSLATTNPTTGLPYEQESATLDYDDLVPDYRARAVGASQMLGRSIRQQNLIALLQMMSANQVLMQLVNWGNFARQAFDLFDFKNVDELLVRQVPAVNQIAQEGGVSPEMVASVVSSPLDQLSPEILGRLNQTASSGLMPSLG
jgi:hypothetical protein